MKAFVTAILTPQALNELNNIMDVVYEPWIKTGEIYFDARELAEKLEGVDIFITQVDDIKKKKNFLNSPI